MNILDIKIPFLAKDLIKTDQPKNKQIAKQTIDSINELRNSIINKEIPENENPNKIIDIVEKTLTLISKKRN